MNKDAYYFPHFSNARTDRKLRRVRKELGVEGYGIYFMILEVLRDQEDFSYPISDIDLLADDFGTSDQKVQVVISNYGLFVVDNENYFYSPKLIEYLKPYLERSKRARQAALKRWNNDSNAKAYANALQNQSDGNASKVKNSKEEKSKLKESKGEYLTTPIVFYPDETTFYDYGLASLRFKKDFLEQVYNSKMATEEDGYWFNGSGNKITNWKHWLKSLQKYNDDFSQQKPTHSDLPFQ